MEIFFTMFDHGCLRLTMVENVSPCYSIVDVDLLCFVMVEDHLLKFATVDHELLVMFN